MYTDLKQLREFNPDNYYSEVVELQYAPQEGLKKAIERVCNEVEMLVKNKRAAFVILSDRNIKQNRLVIPAAMAVGAVQRRLVEKSLRCDANVVVETASARDPHHFAVLIGLGATAVYPFLAYETIEQLCEKGELDISPMQATLNYRKGINKGLYKIMSKMGISTVASYRSSKLFEAVGINNEVMKYALKV